MVIITCLIKWRLDPSSTATYLNHEYPTGFDKQYTAQIILLGIGDVRYMLANIVSTRLGYTIRFEHRGGWMNWELDRKPIFLTSEVRSSSRKNGRQHYAYETANTVSYTKVVNGSAH